MRTVKDRGVGFYKSVSSSRWTEYKVAREWSVRQGIRNRILLTGTLCRAVYVLPGQTVSVRRIYKLLLLMLPGKGVTKKQPPLPDSKKAEWSLWRLYFVMSGHAVNPDRFLLSCEVFWHKILNFYFVMNAAKLNLHSDVTFICFSEACPQIELLSCGRTVLPRLLLSFQKPVCCHAPS